jgi:hypothetical protein
MANVFKEFDLAGGYHIQNVPDVSDQASDSADSRFLLRRLREFANVLPFISRIYNPAGLPVAARPEELELFVTATADAAMDVEALAAAFNISKAEFASRKTVLPVEHFGIDGVQAILTTNKFFVVADQRIETTAIQNPSALFTNYWLHHWEVISASRFAPLVMFSSTRPTTVIPVTATPVTAIGTINVKDENDVVVTELLRGNLYDVEVNAVTTPAGGVNNAVRYVLENTHSAFSRVSNGGGLFIGADETAESAIIKVYATDSVPPQIQGTKELPINGDQIIVWPNPSVATDDTPGIPAATANKKDADKVPDGDKK